MQIIERALVRAINKGSCFLLVGAGPSCEIGYPTWQQLAAKVKEAITDKVDIKQADQLLMDLKYPEFFGLVEKTIGRTELISAINATLKGTNNQGVVYKQIASWPFQVYLTTNFDDEVLRHLKLEGRIFATRKNTKEDLLVLHSSAEGLIFKIHGDVSTPETMVVTDVDYDKVKNSPDLRYWRETIFGVLRMVNLVIIGYRVSDPDFEKELERLEGIACIDHPIFMFAANIDSAKASELFLKKNIHVISYTDIDGKHEGLKRILQRYSPFIAKHGSSFVGLPEPNLGETHLASSLYLFTKLRLIEENESCMVRSFAAVIIQVVADFGLGKAVEISALIAKIKTRIFASGVDPDAFKNALEYVRSKGLIELSADGKLITLKPLGSQAVNRSNSERNVIEEKFEAWCSQFLGKEYKILNGEEFTKIIEAMKLALVHAFEARGMEIARHALTGEAIALADSTDILTIVNGVGDSLKTYEQRGAFADLAIEVFLKNGSEAKEYLATLSQGYFAYHALALDQRCSDERLKMAQQKEWIIDSSIVLSLLGKYSLNHDYAVDLLKRMSDLQFDLKMTKNLVDEVYRVANWAIRSFISEPAYSTKMLLAAEVGSNSEQNLFIDGYVKWAGQQANPYPQEYLVECFGSEYANDLRKCINDKIQQLGINVFSFDNWDGFVPDDIVERDQLTATITETRKAAQRYTSDHQCVAEAEVVVICKKNNTSFLSQSSFLNNYRSGDDSLVWKPEALFKLMTLFSSVPPNRDILYECMMQDFVLAGFKIIDESSIEKYATPLIRQARMKLDQERASFIRTLGKKRFDDLEKRFEDIPDAQKPFYSVQFAYYVAEQAEQKKAEAEARALRAKQHDELTAAERKELEQFRKTKDEKHRKFKIMQKKKHSGNKRRKK